MAVVLVRLKLAIQRHQRGSSPIGQVAALWGRWLVALVLGIAAGAAVRGLDVLGADVAVLAVLLVVFVGWVVLPLLVPGLADTTVDPERLEMFPISAREQVAGLLLAGLVAPTALFTFLVAVGGAALPGEAWWARLLAVVAAVAYTAVCVGASRSLQAVVAGALRTRHGRDLVYIVAGAFSLVAALAVQDQQRLVAAVATGNDLLVGVLTWLPPGATGRTLSALRDGAAVTALGFLAVSLAWVALFALAWMTALRRRLDGATGGLRPRRRDRNEADLALLVEPLRAMRPTPARAAMAQQLRYYFARSPRASQMVLAGVLGGGFTGHATVTSNGLVVGAVVLAAFMGMQMGATTFAFDDRGAAWLVQAGAPMRDVVAGKAAAAAAVTSLAVLAFVAAEATITQSWDLAATATLMALATAAGATGVGAVVGVVKPFNQEHPSGSRLGLLGAAVLGMLVAFTSPFLVGMLLDAIGLPPDTLPSALVALLVGAAIGWALTTLAGRRAAADPIRIADALGVA